MKKSDQFPGVGSVTSSRMTPPKVDNSVNSRADASTGKRWWISKSVGYGLKSEYRRSEQGWSNRTFNQAM